MSLNTLDIEGPTSATRVVVAMSGGVDSAVAAALQTGDPLGYTEAMGRPSLRARIGERLDLCRRAIPDCYLMSRVSKARCDRTSHGAQARDSDFHPAFL